jgi:LPS-assembly lipoprotein
MSWSRRAVLAGAGAGAVAACGFEPVYAPGTADDALAGELAAVQLPDAETVFGFELRRALERQLDPTGRGAAKRYRLDTRLRRQVEDLAIQLDAVVTRQDLTVAAVYELVELAEGRVVDRGRVERTASFNIRGAPYSDLVAEEDADRRVAEALAVALRQRLVAHFERTPA